MDNIIVNRSTKSVIEFDMNVDGASPADAVTSFVLHCEGFDISVPCERSSDRHFIINVPPMPFLQKGVVDCSIHVIINNQFFKPLSGTATIVDDVKVTVNPPKHNEENEEVVDSAPVGIPQSVSSLTRAILHHNVANEAATPESKNDKKVKDILESLNIKTTTPKKRKSSLKKIAEQKRNAT